MYILPIIAVMIIIINIVTTLGISSIHDLDLVGPPNCALFRAHPRDGRRPDEDLLTLGHHDARARVIPAADKSEVRLRSVRVRLDDDDATRWAPSRTTVVGFARAV